MFSVRQMSRLLVSVCFILLVGAIRSINAQNHPQSVTDVNSSGIKPFGSINGNDLEYVDLNNGGVNITIPFITKKGRGLDFNLNINYSSKFWNPDASNSTWTIEGGGVEHVDNYVTGWRTPFFNLTANYADQICDPNIGVETQEIGFVLRDGNDGNHAFENMTPISCDPGYPRELSQDMTGMMLLTSAYTGPHTLYMPNGMKYKFKQNPDASNYQIDSIEDSNGNRITMSWVVGTNGYTETWTDTLGRPVAVRSFGPCQKYTSPLGDTTAFATCPLSSVTVWDSNGNARTYNLTWIAIDVFCSFQNPPCQLWSHQPGLVLSQITLPNMLSYRFGYKDTTGAYNPGGELMRIDLPSGGYVRYEYQTLPKGDPSNGFVSDSRVVTKRVHSPDGVREDAWLYSYARTYNAGGWAVTQKTTTVTDPSGNQEMLTFDYLNSPNQTQFFETHHEFRQGSSTVLKRVDQTWEYDTVSCILTSPTSPCTTENINYRVISRQITLPQTNQVATTVFGYDRANPDPRGPTTRGNLIQTQEYDYGTGAPGALIRTTVRSYLATNPINGVDYTTDNLHIWRRLSSEVIHAGAANGPILAQTQYEYDNYTENLVASGSTQHDTSFGTGYTTRGNVTAIQRWRNTDGAWLTTRNQYDDAGNVSKATDPLLNSTRFSYADSWGNNACAPLTGNAAAYVTSVTDALGHIASRTYNSCTGTTASATDANSQSTSFNYDLMNRLTVTNFPDTGQTTNCYTDMGGATCSQTPAPFSIFTTRKINSTTNLATVVRTDGLARVKQSQLTSDPDCPTGDKTDTTYDGLGHVYTVSNPYCTTGDPAYGLTTYAYDALGRTTQVAHPDGTTILTSYTGRATQVQDEGNGTRRVTRISQTDALGRLRSLCEVSGASLIGSGGTPGACGQDIAGTGFLTSYQYDALDNLTSVSQGGLNPRTFAYDSLSRLTSATNPESGSTSYTYDSDTNCSAPNSFASLLVSKVDARGIRTCMQYDALNRVTQKNYSDGTPTASFNFDQTSAYGVTLINTKGRLSSHSTASPNPTGAVFSYDQMGRVKINSQCTPQNCSTPAVFPVTDTYDLLGDIITSTNGAGITLTYAVNTAARITTLTSSLSDSNHPGTLFSSAHYNAAGSLLSATLGGSVSETRTYDARLRLATIADGSNYSLTIPSSGGYAPNGDILAANDFVNGNWTYTYDDFNRLMGSNKNSGAEVYSYDYDRLGNRWHQNGTHTMMLSFSGSNNRMDGYSYDAAGNLLSDGTHSYSYDAENRLTKVDNGSTATYLYDADGQRVRKTTSSGSVDYLYDLGGHEITELSSSGSWNRGEVYASGRHLATYGNNTTYLIHTDHLGTERVRTNSSGTSCETVTSLPFGDWQTTSGSCGDVTPMHFTGKERDSESGLDYFGARYYGSAMGRFMIPDWASKPAAVPYAEFGDPQSLNLYSYVRNNPLNRVDADGHCWPFCDVAAKLAAWVGAGVATQGGKQFAQNVGIGAAKGAGAWVANTARTAVAIGQASSPGGAVSAVQTMTAALPSALTPSNQTQADVSKATQVTLTVASIAAPLLMEASAASTTTTLFRAVGAAEAESIDATGAFSGAPNGSMFKGFFFDQGDAESFGARMTEMTGEPHSVVSGEAPTDLVNSSPPHSAATEGPGVLIKNEDLPNVKPND